MLADFVVTSCLCSNGFSPGTPVFLPLQKPTFPNSNSTWKQWREEPLHGFHRNSHLSDVSDNNVIQTQYKQWYDYAIVAWCFQAKTFWRNYFKDGNGKLEIYLFFQFCQVTPIYSNKHITGIVETYRISAPGKPFLVIIIPYHTIPYHTIPNFCLNTMNFKAMACWVVFTN